jgi:predicted transcriptional regulator
MSSIGKKVALVLGVAAGAALAVFASSKTGQKEIRKIGDRSQGMRDDLLNMIDRDVTRLKKMSQRFI